MRALTLSTALFVALFLGACNPQVGDGCITDSECDRTHVCDTTSPGGYCLSYECEPNECGEHAVCVAFEGDSDEVILTACMRSCEVDADCRTRDGYVCRNANETVRFCGIPPVE